MEALSNPFAWGFLVLGAALLILATKGTLPDSSTKARWKKKAKLSLGVLALLFAIGEVALDEPVQAAELCHHDEAARPDKTSSFDADLGYGPIAGRAVPALAMGGGGHDFGGVFTIDDHGLRRAPSSEATDALLFFGGSFTFGLGVPDEATTAFQVGSQLADEYRVYNFSYGGYGPHQMLAALQAGRVEETVDAEPKYAVYQLIMNHVRRACGRTSWNIHDPRFVMGEGDLVVRDGRHCDPLPEPAGGLALLQRSAIYREATSHTTNAHVDLTIAIVATAREELQARYPDCQFHVIVWDLDTWKSRRVLSQLAERNMDVHLVSDILPEYAADDEHYCNSPADPHPNPEAHRLLADYIVREIAK